MRVCRLEPGTVLPARVVMIAGLDDGRFPRGGGTPPWDILLQSRRDADHDPLEGEDPDPREDALDAFRDALRSASDAMHLSWTGRSIMDNALRSPSVAVSELLDAVDLVVATPDGATPHAHFLIDEPLQPFAPRLFGEASPDTGPAPLQSAAARWATAATTVRNPAAQIPPFLSAPLPGPPPLATIKLDDLCEAFGDPVTWFWRRTLGLPKPIDRSVEEDREPILAEDHEQLNIHGAVINLAKAGVARTTTALVEQVELAYGQLGPAVVAQDDAVRAVAVAEATGHAANGVRMIALPVGGVTIEGTLDRIGETAMHHVVQYPVSARLCLDTWVRHLILNATATNGTPRTTVIIGVGKNPERIRAVYRPVEEPLTHLAQIIALFEALRRAPVPLFPKSAFEVAVALRDGKDPAGAARRRWESQYRQGGPALPGEGDSPIIERLFPNDELDDVHHPDFWSQFLELTERLVVPAVEHLTRGADA
jgi:exodeoxyribonuclease V gamma subunit